MLIITSSVRLVKCAAVVDKFGHFILLWGRKLVKAGNVGSSGEVAVVWAGLSDNSVGIENFPVDREDRQEDSADSGILGSYPVSFVD